MSAVVLCVVAGASVVAFGIDVAFCGVEAFGMDALVLCVVGCVDAALASGVSPMLANCSSTPCLRAVYRLLPGRFFFQAYTATLSICIRKVGVAEH